MNCRDFERAWNHRLDAREEPPEAEGVSLEAHAAECPACRSLAVRYRTLRQALAAWGPPPAVPEGFADRVLQHLDVAEVRPASRAVALRAWWIPIALAASLVLVVLLANRQAERGGRAEPGPAPAPSVASGDPRPLTDALAEATSASWDLAWHASAPAARIGRQVIDSASVRLPSATLSSPVRVRPVSGVLQSVEERVNAGVRPLSGSARRAFGFLLGTPPIGAPAEGPDAPRGA
jgi:hypothetical protein